MERQKARANAYAVAHGWTVADEHVYEDDGISGAEFDRRPGLQRLLTALKRRVPFRILIVMDESRLGRESIETSHVLKQFSLCGIRVFAYLDDREVLLDNLMDKIALLGHVAGGRVYGYDNVEVVSSVLDAYGRPKRDHVERKINEEQAAVVRRIFTLCAEGKGMVSVARLLNDEGLPAPWKSFLESLINPERAVPTPVSRGSDLE